MHNALFALGTWKRVVSKHGRWLNLKFIFAILCTFTSEYNPKKYLKRILVRGIFLELHQKEGYWPMRPTGLVLMRLAKHYA